MLAADRMTNTAVYPLVSSSFVSTSTDISLWIKCGFSNGLSDIATIAV